MTCNEALHLIPLYLYGEVASEVEEQVEDHLHSCLECTREIERQRSLSAAFDRRQLDASPQFTEECRRDLLASLYRGQTQPRSAQPAGPWRLFLDAVSASFSGMSRLRIPAGAMALVAVGFLAGRLVKSTPATVTPAPSEQVFATVRSVQPDAGGRVSIAFDETRRRTIAGMPDDEHVRRLLLAAARDDNNAAVRVESVGLLQAGSGSGDIREALLNALAHDPNAGVRLKALGGLKPLAGDPQVRRTLATALLTDDNPAVRMQVIDLLVTQRDQSMVGVLQNVVQKDNNGYVRLKCEKALKEMNASVGTF